MERYYFDIVNGRRKVDVVGSECFDDVGAIARAVFMATQLAITSPCSHKRHIAVFNASGDEIFRRPIRLKPAA